VTRAHKRALQPWIYAGSIALHGAFALVLSLLPAPERTQTVSIELSEIRKRAAPPKPAHEPPPAPKESKAFPRAQPVAPAPVKVAAAPANELARGPAVEADGFADLGGVALHGDVGAASPSTAPSARDDAAPKTIAHRSKQLGPAAQTECAEPVVKPKVTTPGQITYTKEGQEAEIEGVVRVQVTVDETGKVIAASVLGGLGYGLDERALAAAKETVFEPATLCGKPVIGTKIIAFTFELR
jgi:protein TonB